MDLQYAAQHEEYNACILALSKWKSGAFSLKSCSIHFQGINVYETCIFHMLCNKTEALDNHWLATSTENHIKRFFYTTLLYISIIHKSFFQPSKVQSYACNFRYSLSKWKHFLTNTWYYAAGYFGWYFTLQIQVKRHLLKYNPQIIHFPLLIWKAAEISKNNY